MQSNIHLLKAPNIISRYRKVKIKPREDVKDESGLPSIGNCLCSGMHATTHTSTYYRYWLTPTMCQALC